MKLKVDKSLSVQLDPSSGIDLNDPEYKYFVYYKDGAMLPFSNLDEAKFYWSQTCSDQLYRVGF